MRDARGNLLGGRQNQTIQRHQQCETLEEKEHRRWLAHRDAGIHASFPTSIPFNGIDVPIFKVPELEALGAKRLKERAMNLRDLVDATRSRFFESKPALRLNPHGQPDAIVAWMVDVYVELATAIGYDDLDHAAFGGVQKPQHHSAPPPPHTPSMQDRGQQPCWSQAGLDREAAKNANSPPTGTQSFPWSQHDVVQSDTESRWRSRTPQHDGFSLVPPHMEAGQGRGTDAANNRYRATASAVMLG